MTWIKYPAAKGLPAGWAWTGPCGCGLSPEAHVRMERPERKAHITVPPAGAPERPA